MTPYRCAIVAVVCEPAVRAALDADRAFEDALETPAYLRVTDRARIDALQDAARAAHGRAMREAKDAARWLAGVEDA